jgi:hypothetical protein
MKNKEERPCEKVKTSELLDGLMERPSYENTEKLEKYSKYQAELEERPPFTQNKREIEQILKRLRELENWAQQMSNHKHDNQENIVIPLKSFRN